MHPFFFSPGGQFVVEGVGLLMAFVGDGVVVGVTCTRADLVGLATHGVAGSLG
ncbi:MAG TPA: hypothetical protein VE198_04480 [Actinoallomurus sp.]|nr:hypothetical protein [Actinoallomurus sp.]